MEHGNGTTHPQPSPRALAERPAAPLPPAAPAPLALTYDNHGTLWGTDTPAETEAHIADERANGTPIDEWHTTDRDGQPLRIVRLADPTFLDTICVITPTRADRVAELHRLAREDYASAADRRAQGHRDDVNLIANAIEAVTYR